MAAGIVLFVFLSSAARLLAELPAMAAQPRLAYGVEQVVGGWLPLLIVVLIASRMRGRGSLAADFGLRFRPLDLAIGLLAGILLRFTAIGIAEAVRLATGTPATPFTGGVGGDPVWFVLTAVVAASVVTPVIEELFFRGLVLRSVENAVLGSHDGPRLPGARGGREITAGVVAVVASSLLFVVFHIDGVPESAAAVSRLITLFVVGLVLGSLALLTRRLGPSIAAHAVFNVSVAVLDILVAPAVAPGLS